VVPGVSRLIYESWIPWPRLLERWASKGEHFIESLTKPFRGRLCSSSWWGWYGNPRSWRRL
jgi:hypothetical protein